MTTTTAGAATITKTGSKSKRPAFLGDSRAAWGGDYHHDRLPPHVGSQVLGCVLACR